MNKNKELAQLKNLLVKDRLRNINALNILGEYSFSSVVIYDESALIRTTTDRDWVLFSSISEDELKILQSFVTEDDKNFASIEDWMLPYLIKDKKVKWKLSVIQFYLPEEIKLPFPKNKAVKLNSESASFIYENSEYKNYISEDYIKDRIKRNVSAGIYINNQLAAWGLTQDDGGLGFLHVLHNYRRNGYGLDVTISLINQVRETGSLPFTYVEEDNKKSLNLVSKLGFVKQKKNHWFELE